MTDYLIKEDVFMALTGDITDCTIEEFIARLRDKLSKLPSVTPKEKTRWIPVSEGLPEDYGEYICTMSNDNVQECGFIPSGEKGLIPGWSTCEADGFKKLDYRDIKAWMPLPEPYREVSE